MDRQLKKRTQMQATRLMNQHCENCSLLNRKTPKEERKEAEIYCNTTCPVSLQLKRLGELLYGDSGEGSADGRNWTKDELFYLRNHYSLYSSDHLANQLGRSVESIEKKASKLKLTNSTIANKKRLSGRRVR